jgi:hypothetical protein
VDSLIFYNFYEGTIYKFSNGNFYKSRVISCFQHFQDLVYRNLEETTLFVIENSELHDLELLHPLCSQIFERTGSISEDLFEKFCKIIEKLEENMMIPQIEFQSQICEKDALFDEFLKISSIESKSPSKKGKLKISKKIKNYYKKSLVWQILLNWLLYVIYKENLHLDKILHLIEISRKSFDESKFYELQSEKRSLLLKIESTL